MEESVYQKYEAVIGLEVHIQLLTKSKMYCADAAEYGALPNTLISPISLGYPGTLPKINHAAVEMAVKLGLAFDCQIREFNGFARKNYFYADLPKGYQITQDKTPICTGGSLMISSQVESKSVSKKIHLTRIHMEEDAGKSLHDVDATDTLVDLNRAGTPLCEIVTEPDFRNADEAYAFLTEIRKLVRYLDVCDGNMEEGSMRCDANISVRLKGVEKFGRKVEVKNMNSIRNVHRAIDFEIKRQIDLIESGEVISQETRSFDAVAGSTFSLRSKEDANDYRYFPEPDLQPVVVSEKMIAGIRSQMPELPSALFLKYTSQFGLSEYDANVLTETKEIALYFNDLLNKTKNYKSAANWVMGDIKSFLNERALEIESFPLSAGKMAEMIELIDSGKISHSAAKQKIFPALILSPNKSVLDLAIDLNLIQESNSDALQVLVSQAIAKYPEKVLEYKNGKVNLIGLFMGEVMKLSQGKADPKIASELVKSTLDNQ
jgi:aspartyl-tRNA(Asn)/glutamyl-tRNA(Gln) amidotransferase subunit B